MSEPAAVSEEYIKIVNKEGLYIQEGNIVKQDLQNGKLEIICICVNEGIAEDMTSGLNLLDDNRRRLELE